MGIREFIKDSLTLFKLARKPARNEFLLALRITLLGVGIIGVIAFIIRFVALAIQGV
ncbi:MAG: protein translocase SEC61 complex subunit gamma [Candidatus Caldarchaeales archaeon]